MKAALQIYSLDFDADFFKLPRDIQAKIGAGIDRLGQRLDRFSHTRLTGGDYRVLYDFNLSKVILYLLAVGHRREICRK